MVNESAVVVFDDERVVANARVMLPALLAQRLGTEALIDECVDRGDRPGAAHPGRKVMTMVSAFALGADCIDDCDALRLGHTAAVLGHRVLAPLALGTFLRPFTFGHARQLDRVLGVALERAWAAGGGRTTWSGGPKRSHWPPAPSGPPGRRGVDCSLCRDGSSAQPDDGPCGSGRYHHQPDPEESHDDDRRWTAGLGLPAPPGRTRCDGLN